MGPLDMNLLFNTIFFFSIFILTLGIENAEIKNSIELLCANEECSVPITKASAITSYIPNEKWKTSIKPGEEVSILGKSKEKKDELFLIQNKSGKKGLIPSNVLKVGSAKKVSLIIVNYSLNDEKIIENVTKEKINSNAVHPTKVIEVEGTRIPDDAFEPSNDSETYAHYEDELTGSEEVDFPEQHDTGQRTIESHVHLNGAAEQPITRNDTEDDKKRVPGVPKIATLKVPDDLATLSDVNGTDASDDRLVQNITSSVENGKSVNNDSADALGNIGNEVLPPVQVETSQKYYSVENNSSRNVDASPIEPEQESDKSSTAPSKERDTSSGGSKKESDTSSGTAAHPKGTEPLGGSQKGSDTSSGAAAHPNEPASLGGSQKGSDTSSGGSKKESDTSSGGSKKESDSSSGGSKKESDTSSGTAEHPNEPASLGGSQKGSDTSSGGSKKESDTSSGAAAHPNEPASLGGSQKGSDTSSGGSQKSSDTSSGAAAHPNEPASLGGSQKGSDTSSGGSQKGSDTSSGGSKKESDTSSGTAVHPNEPASSGGSQKGSDTSSGGSKKESDISSGGSEKESDTSSGTAVHPNEPASLGGSQKGSDTSSGGSQEGSDTSSGGSKKESDTSSGTAVHPNEPASSGGSQKGSDTSSGGSQKGSDTSSGGSQNGSDTSSGAAAHPNEPASLGGSQKGSDTSSGGSKKESDTFSGGSKKESDTSSGGSEKESDTSSGTAVHPKGTEPLGGSQTGSDTSSESAAHSKETESLEVSQKENNTSSETATHQKETESLEVSQKENDTSSESAAHPKETESLEVSQKEKDTSSKTATHPEEVSQKENGTSSETATHPEEVSQKENDKLKFPYALKNTRNLVPLPGFAQTAQYHSKEISTSQESSILGTSTGAIEDPAVNFDSQSKQQNVNTEPPNATTVEEQHSSTEKIDSGPEQKDTASSILTVEESSIEESDGKTKEGSQHWFSSILSVMGSVKDLLGVSQETIVDPTPGTLLTNIVNVEKEEDKLTESSSQYCETDQVCHNTGRNIFTEKLPHYPSEEGKSSEESTGYSVDLFNTAPSLSSIVCLFITAVVILLFSLGHYYLEGQRRDAELILKINKLSGDLFVAQKELQNSEEQLLIAQENFSRMSYQTSGSEELVENLKRELDENRNIRIGLENEIKRLETEIESLVESGHEMHRMLSESLSEDERIQSFLSNIAELKSVLSTRLEEIGVLTQQLDMEKQKVELLTINLKKSEDKREAMESRLESALFEIDSKALTVTKEFEEKITYLERILEERSLEGTNLESEISHLKRENEALSRESELCRKELKKVHKVGSAVSLEEWMNIQNVRLQILKLETNVQNLVEERDVAKNRVRNLEDKEKEVLAELEILNNKYEKAEKEKIEALTKLQVLSNYFKEKEIQLQEELGTKEAQWLQKQSEDHTIYEQMRSLREENLSYKAQNETLKKEILDQETSFKIQIANEEQKSQENWVNLRHTERRLKELQIEASHLRSRLTSLESNSDGFDDKHGKGEVLNGGPGDMGSSGVPTSPPFMLYPHDFLPPPPLISPNRPPPLGRISSPSLTPPPPLSPYDLPAMFQPPPPSPPPPHRHLVKPHPTREHKRKQKNSQSSNHSSESIEKQPLRRGKR